MGLIKKLPLNERPREKAFLYGIETLSNAELLAILLCTGSKKQDVIELANMLINEMGSLSNISSLSLQELSSFNGIKCAKALKIKAALELHHRMEKEKYSALKTINTLKEAASFFITQNYDENIENLQIMLLNQKNELIATKILAIGSINSIIYSPSEIISYAIKTKAKKIIIAHNHPSNIISPSENDKNETERLSLLSSLMGLDFLDHLILGKEKFYSFSHHEESYYF